MTMNTFLAALGSLRVIGRRAGKCRKGGANHPAGRSPYLRDLRLEQLELRALLSGSYPWNPEPAKAALMVVSAHPDDEGIFFGGVIPYYSTVADVPMVHISMTAGWFDGGPTETRQNELRDADWAYGLRNEPIFAGFADFYDMGRNSDNETFDVWLDGRFDNDPGQWAPGRLAAASYLATQIRIYQPDVIVTQDLEGEYGHGNHMAAGLAAADAFALAADPNFTDGNAPWQAQKLYTHLYDREPAYPMIDKLWMDWSTPSPELGGKTPLEVADEGLAMHVSEGGSELVTTWEGRRFSEQWGLYLSAVGPDTVSADGWAHTDFFENVVPLNTVPVRTAGTLTPIGVAEDSANATAVTLGLSGLSYSPGGGADESDQTLTYTLTGIPSCVQIFQEDGATPVNVDEVVTASELQGLKYKTVADANGGGNLTWTVRDDGLPPQTLTENLAITVSAVNDAPVLDSTKSPALNAEKRNGGMPLGPVGTLVSSLADFASPSGQVDNITDADSGALLGIAVTAANTSNGKWWYSTNNGASWSMLGSVSAQNSRLLAADAGTRIYFQPRANYYGVLFSAIAFRAWDQTSGANGGLANTSVSGGTSAFSSATDTASLVVTRQNASTGGPLTQISIGLQAIDAALSRLIDQRDTAAALASAISDLMDKHRSARLGVRGLVFGAGDDWLASAW
jgi:LmbE family N-acetylglucosaminyl deacetylase